MFRFFWVLVVATGVSGIVVIAADPAHQVNIWMLIALLWVLAAGLLANAVRLLRKQVTDLEQKNAVLRKYR